MPNKPEDEDEEELVPEEEDEGDELPDRPLECTECRKPVAFRYTEMADGQTGENAMCADCPVLKKRLFGVPFGSLGEEQAEGGLRGLACGNCGTTLDALKVGSRLGCSVCYEVFEDILLAELHAMGKIPARLATAKKSQPTHIGRAKGESQEASSSMRLLALNEALNETIQREDYEQAAWLRDQIKALEDQEKKNDV